MIPMKSICIAGASQIDLQPVFEILRRAGMQPARSAQGDASNDMALWHQRVIAKAREDGAAVGSISNLSRLPEQEAREIFRANREVELWGWADARSTWMLDFWHGFDAGLDFILLCVSPRDMLAEALAQPGDVKSVDGLMQAWQAAHEELLHFHHRHAGRSLLVDARDCLAHPGILIEHCVERWQLPLPLVAARVAARRQPDTLARYLAQQMCRDYRSAIALQNEIAATITRLGPAESGPPAVDADLVLAAYRALGDRSPELQEALAARAEVAAVQARFDSAVAAHGRQRADLESRIEQGNQESELLLSQLYQIQEELEAGLAANQQQAEALAAAQAGLDQAGQDHELQSLQLQQVQHELEHYFQLYQDAQKQLKKPAEYWQRMLRRIPDYFDFESLAVLPAADGQGKGVSWRLKDVNACGRSLAQLDFTTIVDGGVAGLVLPRLSGGANTLTRWPADVAGAEQATLIPVGEPAARRLETLRTLATRDWDLLRALARSLAAALEKPAALDAPPGFEAGALRAALEQLGRLLAKLPACLRYDRVSLKREQVNPDYEHLWLRFENLSLGGKHWPEFEVRLSCADVRPDSFGQRPKLEFPEETSQDPFEAWFIEASDDFGVKLELRFALPDSMDLAVWRRVSENDRAFLAALIERLPAILDGMRGEGVTLKRSWNDWIEMARAIQRVTALRTGPGSARTKSVLGTLARLVQGGAGKAQ